MQDFGTVAEALRRSTVSVGSGRGGGSGIIWNAGGLILTNAHVAHGERATVEFWDGAKAQATVVKRSDARDLAALRTPRTGLPELSRRASDTLRPGELAIAVGNPLGFQGALSTGVVHAVGPLRGLGRREWVQAAVRLAPGNSGGPLADAQGRVVGINTMIAGGLALAVPSNTIAAFLRGEDQRLGVEVRPVAVGNRLGLLVLAVERDSAAEAASLLIGDVLTGVNGRAFETPADLALAIEEAASGALHLEFLRGGRSATRTVTAVLRARSAEAA
jgi:serine protease Do